MYFAACHKVVKPKLKPSPPSAAPAPFIRQLSIPVTKAHAYQAQFAQNRTAQTNGDVGSTPKSAASLVPASSVAPIPQVRHNHFIAGELVTCIYFVCSQGKYFFM